MTRNVTSVLNKRHVSTACPLPKSGRRDLDYLHCMPLITFGIKLLLQLTGESGAVFFCWGGLHVMGCRSHARHRPGCSASVHSTFSSWAAW